MNLYPRLNQNSLEITKLSFLDYKAGMHSRHKSIDSSSLGSDSTWHIPISEYSNECTDSEPYFNYHEEELLRQESGKYHILHRPKLHGQTIKVVRRREYSPLSIEEMQRISLDSFSQLKHTSCHVLPPIDGNKLDFSVNQKVKPPAESFKEQEGYISSGRINSQTVPNQLNLKKATSERVLQKSRSVSPLKKRKFSTISHHKLHEVKSWNLERIIYPYYSKHFIWKMESIKPKTFQELSVLLNSIQIAPNPKLNKNLPSRSRQKFQNTQRIESDSIKQEFLSFTPLLKKCEAVKRSISPLIDSTKDSLSVMSSTNKLLKGLVNYPDVSHVNPSDSRTPTFTGGRFKWHRNG